MSEKPKVVFDTNIFVNGTFYSDSHEDCSKIIDWIKAKKFKVLFSQDTIGELLYVMKIRSNIVFQMTCDKLNVLKWITELFFFSKSIDTRKTDCSELHDKSDAIFLKCAIEGEADYLVSNDTKSGLHKIKNEKIKIITSKEFVELLGTEEKQSDEEAG